MIVHKTLAILREWLYRLCGSFRLRANDEAFREELAHHLASAEEKYLEQGHSPAEAARLARAHCGQADNTLELLRRQRSIPWFGAFTLDVKLGLRMLRKSLGLTLIGGLAMTVVFAVILAIYIFFDAVMWTDSVPLDEGDRVAAIQIWDAENGRRSEISIDDFERWRAELGSLDDVGAFTTVEHEIAPADGEPESVPMAEISAAGFRLARVTPLLGRTLIEDDEREAAAPVIVIGYDEWRSRFNGDDDALGRQIRVDGRLHTIVGIMPKDFGFPINHQFWLPLHDRSVDLIAAPPRGGLFARLAPGVSFAEAEAELSVTGLLPDAARAERAEPLRPAIVHYATNFIDDSDPSALSRRAGNARLVMLLVCLLLVPPCANIALLVYARTVTRREEIAVRTALGASRSRIVVQIFLEMLVLCVLAACIALVAVDLLMNVVEQSMLRDLARLPFWIDIGLSADRVLFCGALALLAAAITGLLPALRATRAYAKPGLSALDSRHTMRLGPIWTALIVAQIGFSFAALPSAVELGWGTLRTAVLGPGFAADEYLTARLSFDSDDADRVRVSEADTAARFDDARRRFVRRLETDSRILTPVTTASALPGQGQWMRYRVEDGADATGQEPVVFDRVQIGMPQAQSVAIDEDYLDVFDIDVLTGREFAPGEYRSDARSVLINATFARQAFGDANPLGRRISFGIDTERYEIVGVIADRPAHPYSGSVFHPAGAPQSAAASIAFRTSSTDGSLREELRSMARAIDPALATDEIRTLQELYDDQAAGNYLGGFALIVGSLSVLGLAAAGTYALMAFTVNQRRREIAIRLALGARPHKLLGGIFKTALRKVAIGAALGIVLALLVQSYIPARTLGGLDVPGILPGASTLLLLIGVAAAFGPARRALGTDPTESLKREA
jgi:predicted permease